MKPFQRAYFGRDQTDALRARLRRAGVAQSTIDEMLRRQANAVVFRNDRYQVDIEPVPATPDMPALIHLSIKTIDKAPVHDWRDLQAIKNELVGPEHEGVELYPAESRLTDTANQYHIWCLADPTTRFPFGWQGRVVSTPAEAAAFGAKQREL